MQGRGMIDFYGLLRPKASATKSIEKPRLTAAILNEAVEKVKKNMHL
jgi:hypothetical protein